MEPKKCSRCGETEDEETIVTYNDNGDLLCQDCQFMDFCETTEDLYELDEN